MVTCPKPSDFDPVRIAQANLCCSDPCGSSVCDSIVGDSINVSILATKFENWYGYFDLGVNTRNSTQSCSGTITRGEDCSAHGELTGTFSGGYHISPYSSSWYDKTYTDEPATAVFSLTCEICGMEDAARNPTGSWPSNRYKVNTSVPAIRDDKFIYALGFGSRSLCFTADRYPHWLVCGEDITYKSGDYYEPNDWWWLEEHYTTECSHSNACSLFNNHRPLNDASFLKTAVGSYSCGQREYNTEHSYGCSPSWPPPDGGCFDDFVWRETIEDWSITLS